MIIAKFSHEQIIRDAHLTPEDVRIIHQRRRSSNRLGFAYQLTYVRLANHFPTQQPLAIAENLLAFVALQLGVPSILIEQYQRRRPTISEHRQLILTHLNLTRFEDAQKEPLEEFLFHRTHFTCDI